MEIQMDTGSKAVRLRIWDNGPASGLQAGLELTQSEMFELLHTLLTINRSFNLEAPHNQDTGRTPAQGSPSLFSQAAAGASAIS
ncbi:hypothetical protein WMW72_05295 [Paenibacillus filicis]|uniref:Uncharacterized protein n=1 Tax=Paenibacillus filicis TaxID=669464 RepID=A0ABU9DEM4_9BACL